MKEIPDTVLLNSYLQRFHIDALFNAPELPFRLYEYQPGELLNLAHPSERYLKFLVEGSIRIYAISADGSRRFLVECQNGFEVLGDMEFCGYCEENHFQEALQRVRTIELPLQNVGEQLWKDSRFLGFLLRHIGAKLTRTAHARSTGHTLEEQLLHYLRCECPDHRITCVEDTAFRLNYSRAQLQRVLRSLTQRMILKKQGRGTYELSNP